MICSPACFLQTAAEKAERSALSGIVPADRLPEQQPQQSLAVERNQRIEVSLSNQRLGGAEQNEDAHHPQTESPDIEDRCDQQQRHPQQLKGVAPLIAGLGKSSHPGRRSGWLTMRYHAGVMNRDSRNTVTRRMRR